MSLTARVRKIRPMNFGHSVAGLRKLIAGSGQNARSAPDMIDAQHPMARGPQMPAKLVHKG